MMNKILYVARKIKDLTESEIADILEMDENEYQELENGIKRMTSEYADKLGELFNLGAEHFMTYEYGSMQDLTDVLENHRKILDAEVYKQTDGSVHLRIARMGLEASIAVQENYVLLREKRDIERENQVLRELYKDLKKRKSYKQNKPDNSEIKKK